MLNQKPVTNAKEPQKLIVIDVVDTLTNHPIGFIAYAPKHFAGVYSYINLYANGSGTPFLDATTNPIRLSLLSDIQKQLMQTLDLEHNIGASELLKYLQVNPLFARLDVVFDDLADLDAFSHTLDNNMALTPKHLHKMLN